MGSCAWVLLSLIRASVICRWSRARESGGRSARSAGRRRRRAPRSRRPSARRRQWSISRTTARPLGARSVRAARWTMRRCRRSWSRNSRPSREPVCRWKEPRKERLRRRRVADAAHRRGRGTGALRHLHSSSAPLPLYPPPAISPGSLTPLSLVAAPRTSPHPRASGSAPPSPAARPRACESHILPAVISVRVSRMTTCTLHERSILSKTV